MNSVFFNIISSSNSLIGDPLPVKLIPTDYEGNPNPPTLADEDIFPITVVQGTDSYVILHCILEEGTPLEGDLQYRSTVTGSGGELYSSEISEDNRVIVRLDTSIVTSYNITLETEVRGRLSNRAGKDSITIQVEVVETNQTQPKMYLQELIENNCNSCITTFVFVPEGQTVTVRLSRTSGQVTDSGSCSPVVGYEEPYYPIASETTWEQEISESSYFSFGFSGIQDNPQTTLSATLFIVEYPEESVDLSREINSPLELCGE